MVFQLSPDEAGKGVYGCPGSNVTPLRKLNFEKWLSLDAARLDAF
jgi:hypothetical protein